MISIPAVRGMHGGREQFITTWSWRMVKTLLGPTTSGYKPKGCLAPAILAEELICRKPPPPLTAICVSIGADVKFSPLGDYQNLGIVAFPFEQDWEILDGSTRCQAIEIALLKRPKLADETIPVLIVKRHDAEAATLASRPLPRTTKRELEESILHKTIDLLSHDPIFSQLVEIKSSFPSARTKKLLALNALKSGTRSLMAACGKMDAATPEFLYGFWTLVYQNMPAWQQFINREITAPQLRETSIAAAPVVVRAIAAAAGNWLAAGASSSDPIARCLSQIDWTVGSKLERSLHSRPTRNQNDVLVMQFILYVASQPQPNPESPPNEIE